MWLGRPGSFYARWDRGGVVLALSCLAVYLAGLFAIGPVDRDESRFAQASRQMFESVALPDYARKPEMHSGGLAIPYYGTTPRLNKPPLIYWLQAGSAAALTRGDPWEDAIWMYRVPSVLAALVAALATWRLGLGMFDARAAWLGGLGLGVCPVVAWEAHQARADMLLLACCVVMQVALWRVWKAHLDGREKSSRGVRWLMPMLFWGALGAGIMTKGPIAPLLATLTVVALGVTTRRWKWALGLRPGLGLVIVAAMVTPWVVLVARSIGFSTYLDILNEEVVKRATVGSKEGHALPPGVHTLAAFGLLFPLSIVLVQGVVRGWRRGRPRRAKADRGARPGRPAELFLLAWALPFLVVFELVTSKLVHYTLPAYPALALLAARAAWRLPRVWRLVMGWSLGVWVVAGIAGLQWLAPRVAPGSESARIIGAARSLDPYLSYRIVSEHREDSMMFWSRGTVQRVGERRMNDLLASPSAEPWIAVMRADRAGPDRPALPHARRVPAGLLGGDVWDVALIPVTP